MAVQVSRWTVTDLVILKDGAGSALLREGLSHPASAAIESLGPLLLCILWGEQSTVIFAAVHNFEKGAET